MFLTLMYHLVDERIQGPMSVPPANLQGQLEVLRGEGATFLRLEQVNRILDGEAPPANPVLITFDDGYRNTVDVAMPILERHQVPAVVSLCSSYLEPRDQPLRTIHMSQDFATVEEVKRWLDSGRDIAGHTYDHPKLSRLSDAEVDWQIGHDKRLLEGFFGRALDTFFYPFGSLNGNVERIAGRYYRNAFSVARGGFPSPANRLNIGRLEVSPDWGPREFLAVLSERFRVLRAFVEEREQWKSG